MRNKFKFTPTKLHDIPSPDKRIIYYDSIQPGLRFLVTPTGNKSFQFQMWSKKLGKPLTRTLGKFRTSRSGKRKIQYLPQPSLRVDRE